MVFIPDPIKNVAIQSIGFPPEIFLQRIHLFIIFTDLHGSDPIKSTGLVKFIGFVEGNTNDVYIGLRMDEEGLCFFSSFKLV